MDWVRLDLTDFKGKGGGSAKFVVFSCENRIPYPAPVTLFPFHDNATLAGQLEISTGRGRRRTAKSQRVTYLPQSTEEFPGRTGWIEKADSQKKRGGEDTYRNV